MDAIRLLQEVNEESSVVLGVDNGLPSKVLSIMCRVVRLDVLRNVAILIGVSNDQLICSPVFDHPGETEDALLLCLFFDCEVEVRLQSAPPCLVTLLRCKSCHH